MRWRHWLRPLPAACGVFLLMSPDDTPASTALPAPIPHARVVLIAIDGVRHQDIFDGRADTPMGAAVKPPEEVLPQLTALAREGIAWGRDGDFTASGPNFVSLPGYAEILTGQPATCFENDCEALDYPTLADDARRVPGVKAEDVAVFTSWERVFAVAARSRADIVVSTGSKLTENRELIVGTVGAERLSGEHDAHPGNGDYRPDTHTIALAESYFREKNPRFMFVALGDTDELAHKNDFEGYWAALRRADAFIGRLREVARARGEDVAFIITTDHGRAASFREHGRDYPESAAVWMIASGAGLRGSYLDSSARHLSDIAPVVRTLLGVPIRQDEQWLVSTR